MLKKKTTTRIREKKSFRKNHSSLKTNGKKRERANKKPTRRFIRKQDSLRKREKKTNIVKKNLEIHKRKNSKSVFII